MTKIIKINDVDFSDIFEEKSYSVGEVKITGSNGGTALSGKTWEDVIAYKDKVDLPLDPLSEEDLYTLMKCLRDSKYAPYVKLYYYSPNYGEYRTAEFIRDDMTHVQMFISNNGVAYYNGNTLSMTEA